MLSLSGRARKGFLVQSYLPDAALAMPLGKIVTGAVIGNEHLVRIAWLQSFVHWVARIQRNHELNGRLAIEFRTGSFDDVVAATVGDGVGIEPAKRG